ncbi:MAG: HD domain-containing protein [Spirochaetia bacterium]|nr:HD domain-containing protein [Spirochaetia bacterium]
MMGSRLKEQIDESLISQGYIPLETFEIKPDVKFKADIFGVPKNFNFRHDLQIKKLIKSDIFIDQNTFSRLESWSLYVNKEGYKTLEKLFRNRISEKKVQESAFNEQTISQGMRLQDLVFKSITENEIVTKSLFEDVREYLASENTKLIDRSNAQNFHFNLVQDLEGYHRETHIHSLNVALMTLHWANQAIQNESFFAWVDRELEQDYKTIKKEVQKKEFVIDLAVGAFLHDLGKLDIPKEILEKDGTLTDDEFMKIKEHPENGYKRTRHLTLSKRIKQVILFHHVKYNTRRRSYPNLEINPAELGIMRIANMISICDVVEALSAKRSYKNNWTPKNVMIFIFNRRETDFFPELVDAFVKMCSVNIMGEFFVQEGDYCWISEYDSHKNVQGLSLAEIIEPNKDAPNKPVVQILGNMTNMKSREIKPNKRRSKRDLNKEPMAEMTNLLTSENKEKFQNDGFLI